MDRLKNFKLYLIAYCLIIFNNIGFRSAQDNDTLNKNARIIIIGAGPSGIAAATKLMENGFLNVLILEAENRIGGRVYTTRLGNYSIDIGGQWVHGVDGNVVFQLANPYGLLDVSNETNFGVEEEYVDSSGNSLDSDVTKKIDEFFNTYAFTPDFSKIPGYESLGEYVNKKFDEVFKDEPNILNQKRKFLHYAELSSLESDSAETWYQISAAGDSVFKVCSGDQLTNWKERGYSTILDILMNRYPNPENEIPVLNNTILNTEVTSIDYSKNGDQSPVLVTAVEGQLYKADHVIVTVSLGVLKDKHTTLFIPPLPDYKVDAINATGFGAVAKIFMLFDKPFWNLGDDKRVLHFSFLWNEEDRKQMEADPEKKWLLGMDGGMTVERKPQLLLLWVTGNSVKSMEALSEKKVFYHSVENLRRFLGKQYNVSEPIAMMRSRWHSNPHFRGTYSYRDVEAHKKQVFPEMLERPLDEQNLRVLFAGEATESDRSSTVDGAIKSGWKAANRLINHYEKLHESTAPAA